MVNDVVKYHNDLNTIPMRNWTAEEMNFFFAIISKMRNNETNVVEISKNELKELANYSDWNLPRFIKIMENLGEHIVSIRYYERTSRSLKIMNLFSTFEVNWTEDMLDMSVKVGVTENFSYIMNQLHAEFTSYELKEFTSLRSTYTKTIYRLLKQWKTVGKREFKIDEFKRLLDTPDYYTPSHIDKNILKPVMNELPQIFGNLKVKKVKSNTQGTPVTGYIFTWKPEKTENWIEDKYKKKYNEPLPSWMNVDGTVKQTARPENVSSQKEEEIREKLNKLLGDW